MPYETYRYIVARRRNRTRSGGCDAARVGRFGGEDRVGNSCSPRGKHRQKDYRSRSAERRRDRIRAAELRGAQRADGYRDCRRRAQRERGAAKKPGFVCEFAACKEPAGGEIAFRWRGRGDRAREHRGFVLGTGARGGAGRGGETEDHYGEGVNAECEVCV